MKLSNSIKKRFCKDFSLPIGLFDDEAFYYFIELYDVQYNTKAKLKLLEDIITELGSEEAFMQEFNLLKNRIIEDISATPTYTKLAADKNPYPYEAKHQYSGQNIYIPEFAGRKFISIDLCKANFLALKTYDATVDCAKYDKMLDGAESWDGYLSANNDLEYYHKSKQLRQVIFGNLLPKRQQSIQKSMCKEIADTIKAMDSTLELAIVSTDEILILNHPDPFIGVLDVSNKLRSVLGYTDNEIRVEAFELEQIHPEKSYFIKKDLFSSDITFKSIPQLFFAQVFKHYFGKPMNDTDKTFFHEGCTAIFTESIYEGQ